MMQAPEDFSVSVQRGLAELLSFEVIAYFTTA